MRITWPVLLFGATCVVMTAVAAPVPKAKDAPRPLHEAIVGKFTLHWGGVPYRCEIDRDHCYECWSGSCHWVGSVELRDGGKLILSEAMVTDAGVGQESHYEIEVGADLTGRVVDGVSVRLERRVE